MRSRARRRSAAHPPADYAMLRSNFFYYSLRYENRAMWVRNGAVRYGAIDRELGWYRMGSGNVVPGFTAVHCSYCFGSVSEIIRKLQTFPHVEYSAGKYVNPNYILGRVACGLSLFEREGDVCDLREMDARELDLPPQANFFAWKLPFTDLETLEFNLTEVRKWGKCNPTLKVVNGRVQTYE
jgi:hypothetical protein